MALDYMKAILTINMIFAHTIQLLSFFWDSSAPKLISRSLGFLSLFVNITTFSSFLFCFGYVFYVAYFKNFKNSKQKLFRNGINTLIAYYISAFGIYIIDNEVIGFGNIYNILVLNNIIGYSEFLLAFSFISFLTIFIGDYILKITSNYRILLIYSVILIVSSSFIPYSIIPPQLGIFIGSSKFASFPILLYFPYFLLGVYISKNNIVFNKYILIGTAALSSSSILYITIWGMPSRFPPSIFWLTLSFLYTYCLYLLCSQIGKINFGVFFKRIGQNSLLYLLISNLILRYFMHHNPFNVGWWGIFIVTGIIFIVANQIITIVRK